MLVLYNIREKAEVKNNETETWLIFIYYAFDAVRHCGMWESLLECGVPRHLVRLVQRLYTKSTYIVLVGDGQSDEMLGKDIYYPYCV